MQVLFVNIHIVPILFLRLHCHAYLDSVYVLWKENENLYFLVLPQGINCILESPQLVLIQYSF